jgi:hypothetical protein
VSLSEYRGILWGGALSFFGSVRILTLYGGTMKLFPRFFTRYGSETGRRRHAFARSRFQPRCFSFERLEDRKLLDADAFNLISLDDYQADPVLSEFDGSGPDDSMKYSIAVISTGAQLNHPVFGPDVVEPIGIADRIVHQQNFFDGTSPATDEDVDGRGTGLAGVTAEAALALI